MINEKNKSISLKIFLIMEDLIIFGGSISIYYDGTQQKHKLLTYISIFLLLAFIAYSVYLPWIFGKINHKNDVNNIKFDSDKEKSYNNRFLKYFSVPLLISLILTSIIFLITNNNYFILIASLIIFIAFSYMGLKISKHRN